MNFARMLKLLEQEKPTPAQIRQAERILRAAGYRVEEPARWNGGKIPARSPFKRRTPAEGQTTSLPLPGWEGRPAPARDNSQNDLLNGTMFPVESSNVHSIGFQIQNPGDTKGRLLVRFLGQQEHGVRSGIGSLYEYRDVPLSLFRDFQRTNSPGGWVWDHLRVRKTVAGHRFDYALIGVAGAYIASLGRRVENYVPRQAAVRRGQSGQHFIQRTHGVSAMGTRGPGEMHRMGTMQVRSQLSPSMASMRGPNPGRGPGPDALRFSH